MVFLTGPPPKNHKVKPVRKCFQKKLEYPDWPPPKISKYRTTANATAVQFNGALCMHCTRGCFTADISTELRADFQMENEILQCRFVISESLAKMVRHWTTDQRAWIVARKNRGDTLAAWRSWVAPLRGGGSELICEFWPKFVIWPLFAFMH